MMDPVELTKDLIRIPSISREQYHDSVSIVHSISDSIAHSISNSIAHHIAPLVDGTIQEFPITNSPHGTNVIAISEPFPGEPFILLNGHHDTVAVAEGWSTDPLAPVERNGRLYGLGASDMKAGTAINIALFNEFREKLNLIFTSSDDEESDSMGSFALIGQGSGSGSVSDPKSVSVRGPVPGADSGSGITPGTLPEAGSGSASGPLVPYLDRIRGALITEPSNERVMLGARGRYAFRLTVHGRAAHGARPHLGINAVDEAARIAIRLTKIPMDSHPLLGEGSLCSLAITGGTRTLSVPDLCGLVVDRHYTVPMTSDTIIAEFRNSFEGPIGVTEDQNTGTGDGTWDDQGIGRASVDIRPVDREVPFLQPYTTSPDEQFVRDFITGTGIPLPQDFLYGASVGDYNIFGNLLPTIVYGTIGRFHHSPDEYVEIDSIRRVHSQLSRWLDELCRK